jgi:hypothetical protein
MRIRTALLACLVFAASAPAAAAAETAIATKWRPISLDQMSCMGYAQSAIAHAGFDKAEPASQTVSGKRGQYTASIRCLSNERIAFFIIAGPSSDAALSYIDALYNQFGELARTKPSAI